MNELVNNRTMENLQLYYRRKSITRWNRKE